MRRVRRLYRKHWTLPLSCVEKNFLVIFWGNCKFKKKCFYIFQGRTTLVVTHRLSTITKADRIIVLSNGVVAEDGSHDELIRIKGGMYNELLRSQEENVQGKVKITTSVW